MITIPDHPPNVNNYFFFFSFFCETPFDPLKKREQRGSPPDPERHSPSPSSCPLVLQKLFPRVVDGIVLAAGAGVDQLGDRNDGVALGDQILQDPRQRLRRMLGRVVEQHDGAGLDPAGHPLGDLAGGDLLPVQRIHIPNSFNGAKTKNLIKNRPAEGVKSPFTSLYIPDYLSFVSRKTDLFDKLGCYHFLLLKG